MYSYFVFWRDVDGFLHNLNICTSKKLWDEPDPTALYEAVQRRCKELKISFSMAEGSDMRWILDPAHTDPVIWSKDVPKGAVKLAGEFPGRHIYSPEWRKQ